MEEIKEPRKKPIWKDAIVAVLLLIFGASFFAKPPQQPFEYRPITVSTFTRVLGTAYQPSTSRFVSVSCSASITSSLSLSGGQSGTIVLQTSPDNITYTTIATATNNSTGTLIVGINTVSVQTSTLTGTVPAGYYYKFVSSGTSTPMTIGNTQETAL